MVFVSFLQYAKEHKEVSCQIVVRIIIILLDCTVQSPFKLYILYRATKNLFPFIVVNHKS